MNSQVLAEIDRVLSELNAPLRPEDLAHGWSVESQAAAKAYFQQLRYALISNEQLPPLGIVRGLDHRGVTGGDLLENIARVTNALRS